MSWSYIFLQPRELPLTPSTVSEQTVHHFSDAAAIQAALGAVLPQLTWMSDPGNAVARAKVVEDGEDYEITIQIYDDGKVKNEAAAPTLMVSMRCSGRIDSAPFAQRLCDALGWICFDDRAYLFQPNRPAMPGGRG